MRERSVVAAGARLASAAALALTLIVALPAHAPAAAGAPPEVDGEAWIVIDPRDGETLGAKSADAPLPMASTTKLMTALVALESLSLGDVVPGAPYDAGPFESLIGLRPGQPISVRDLMLGMILASGNEAAITAAAAASGSVAGFVRRMNARARELGLTQTSFENPIGFDGTVQHSSARDLASLGAELMDRRFFRRAFDLPSARIDIAGRPVEIVNRNELVHRVPWVTGIKTGFTAGAGYTLVASGERRGLDLIAVVMGTPSEEARDESGLELLRWGFSLHRPVAAVRAGERLASVAIKHRGEDVPVEAGSDVRLLLRRGLEPELVVHLPEEVEGPLAPGERVGELSVSVNGEQRGRAPLVAGREVEAASLLDRLDSALPGAPALVWALGLLLLAVALGANVRHRSGDARKARPVSRVGRR